MFVPKYGITNTLLKSIGSIEASREVIDHAPLVPAWEAKFREDAVVRSVHHGTHLEGNDLTIEQAEQVMKVEGVTNPEEVAKQAGITARDRDIQEVLNYRSVLSWINDWNKEKTPEIYNQEVLKSLHSLTTQQLIPPDQVGEYRTRQVVVRSVDTGEVVYRPPVSVEVPYNIERFFEWLNSEKSKEVHPVLRAGITHYELVRIHPFSEGNGRTARAMALLVLYVEGYDVKRFFSLEEYFDRDIEGYYKALLSVQKSEDQDMTSWLEYFSVGLSIELDRIKQQVLKLSQDVKLKTKLGTQVALSERQIILLELLQKNGQLTTIEANQALPLVSTDTILRDLKDLITKGVIKKHGVTKGVSYRLSE